MSPEKRNSIRRQTTKRQFKSKRGEKWRRLNSDYKKCEKRRVRLEELEQPAELPTPFPYVSLPTAQRAKALGFNLPTSQYYLTFDGIPSLEKNDLLCDWNLVPGEDGSDIVGAPEQHQLQGWLRTVHGVHVKVDLDEQSQWFSILVDVTGGNLLSNWSDPCPSYEYALEDALYTTLVSLSE